MAVPESPVPEVSGEDLTPELIRAALLERGAILVRGLVDVHHGEVAVANTDGGCRFEVRIPTVSSVAPR